MSYITLMVAITVSLVVIAVVMTLNGYDLTKDIPADICKENCVKENNTYYKYEHARCGLYGPCTTNLCLCKNKNGVPMTLYQE